MNSRPALCHDRSFRAATFRNSSLAIATALTLYGCSSDPKVSPSQDGSPPRDARTRFDGPTPPDASLTFVKATGNVLGARQGMDAAPVDAIVRATGGGAERMVNTTDSQDLKVFEVDTPQGIVSQIRFSNDSQVDYFPNLREVIAPAEGVEMGTVTLVERAFWDGLVVAPPLQFAPRDTVNAFVIVDIVYEGNTALTGTTVTLTDSSGVVGPADRAFILAEADGSATEGNVLAAGSLPLVGFHNVTAGKVTVAISNAPGGIVCGPTFPITNYSVDANVLTNISLTCVDP